MKYEYPAKIGKKANDNTKARSLIRYETATNIAPFEAIKNICKDGLILPSTLGLEAVRGFFASYSLSAYLFTVIAKFLAKNAAAIPGSNVPTDGIPCEATTIAIKIKGREKTVCDSITSSEKCFSFCKIVSLL